MSTPPLPHDEHPPPSPETLQPDEEAANLDLTLPTLASAGDGTDLFLNPSAAPTDDTPTIISRAGPVRSARDEAITGNLRGRTLAHFELVEAVGVGGMAAVIRARDLQLDRPVALKILPPEMAADPENVARFQREARAAAKLDHENIARVFFCGEDQRLHFIAFEFVEGENLRNLIERRGRLPYGEVVHYMLQIATGLAHAAERGVVHRDIKPSNIIISPNGRAKLVDMGLARSMEPHDGGLTQSGVTLGTFDYISPEQALEPRDADIRSDIYSLGCTFYHALTGVAPVPEGTAARKLHHHQHVAPTDPRVFNPEIPDEVAAVLARMMSKDAKNRYQRAEHLVQHLMAVAQKVGSRTETPGGVLFMDAPLPAPPQSRPVLMAVFAACALLALVILLGQAPWGPPTEPLDTPLRASPNPGRNPSAPRPDEGVGRLEVGGASRTSPGRPAEVKTAVYDAAEPQPRALAEFLRHNANARVVLNGDLNLSEDANNPATLAFDGESLDLSAPRDAKTRPTIHLSLPSKVGDVWAALTVKKGKVTVRGIRFVIDGHQAPEVAMAAVLRQGGRITLRNCEFVQTAAGTDARLSGVEVVGTGTESGADVEMSECLFAGFEDVQEFTRATPGRHAVTVNGSGRVQVRASAFGPHHALVAFRDVRGRGGQVDLHNCSALLAGDAAVFSLRGAPVCGATVSRSLFSSSGDPFDKVVFVRQEDDASSGFVYRGEDNRFGDLSALWLRPAPEAPITSLDEFRAEVGRASGSDTNSTTLTGSPWTNSDPLGKLDRLDLASLRDAFRVDSRSPELRQHGSPGRLVGLERWPGSPTSYPVPPLPAEVKPAVAGGKLIVDPKARTGDGVYKSLAAAIAEARARDEILIRADGLVPIDPVRLVKPGLDLTIRPHPDSKPVLTLGNAPDPDAFLFQMHAGQLRLVDLHFLLDPKADFRSQTVVAMAGEGECVFQHCSVTMESATDVALSVVQLADPSQVMRMENGGPPKPASRPGVKFEDSFIRGEGDVVAVRVSRPMEVEAKNTLVAVEGSFLQMTAREDAAPTGATVSVLLNESTLHVGQHLVRMKTTGGDTRGLVPLACQAHDCLFLATENRALVHLDGPETTNDKLRSLLVWNGSRNAYVGYMRMLDQTPNDNSMALPPVEQQEWMRFTGESDAAFKGVKLAAPPEGPLARVGSSPYTPRVDANLTGSFGAELDKLPSPPETVSRRDSED